MKTRSRTLSGALLALLVVFAACTDSPSAPEPLGPVETITELPRALSVQEEAVIQGNNRFGLRLLQEVAAVGAAGDNVILSPLSASMALGMTLQGAEANTFDEMRDTLGFDDLSREEIRMAYRDLLDLFYGLDPTVTFRIANSVWHRADFDVEADFTDMVRNGFDAEVEGLDFSSPTAPRRINDWVSQETEGRIERILEGPIDPATMMFLINAIYFNGAWTHQFDPTRTEVGDFTLTDGSTVEVPMMSREEVPVRAILGGTPEDYSAAELPYGGEAFAMTLVLPPPNEDLDAFVSSLDEERWSEILGSLEDTEADVLVPRFQLDDSRELNAALRTLGMRDAFGGGLADFTSMHRDAREMGLHVSRVKQDTWLNVDEQGTEAAAVTTVEVGLVSGPTQIRFDRPFLFAIRERLSGTLVFVGLVNNPVPEP